MGVDQSLTADWQPEYSISVGKALISRVSGLMPRTSDCYVNTTIVVVSFIPSIWRVGRDTVSCGSLIYTAFTNSAIRSRSRCRRVE